MSLIADQYLPVAGVESSVERVAPTAEPVPANGTLLPVPGSEPIAGVLAFLLAGPGSMALAAFTCVALMHIGGGGSLSLWASAMSTLFVGYALAMGAALWAARSRGEWGAEG